jgi:ferredoxin
MSRKRIKIDEEKCVGCGKCIDACKSGHGGALALVDGKAKVVKEDYCDGLGACIGECPFGAISFEEVENGKTPKPATKPAGGCPGSRSLMFENKPQMNDAPAYSASALNAWPIQLHLVSPAAAQFKDADILIAASCSAFSMGAFHKTLLEGRALVIACPKLDVQDGYLEKLTELFASKAPKSVTIARMEVPCCSGLTNLVVAAKAAARSSLPLSEVVIGLNGEIKGIKIL